MEDKNLTENKRGNTNFNIKFSLLILISSFYALKRANYYISVKNQIFNLGTDNSKKKKDK